MNRDADVSHRSATLLARLAAKRLSPVALQTVFLFAVDGISNAIDYGFHIYLGRRLTAEGFAIVQTLNTALLVVVTAAGVLQPVVARQVAEIEPHETTTAAPQRTIFQHYLRLAARWGLLLALVTWLGREPIATWLNVPAPAVSLGAAMLLLSFLRPVVAGVLQGQQRFVAFGATRLAYAGGRLFLSLILVGLLSGGTLAAVASLPLGAALALLLGLLWLGRAVWQPTPSLAKSERRQGWGLSAAALLAYTAYMLLLSQDLIWVNRAFAPEIAADYATAVLLRRVLLLLPGAVIVILFPRVVATFKSGRRFGALLARAGVAVTVPTLLLSGLYAVAGELVITLTFGPLYVDVAPMLGWLGLATLGYGLVSIWMNTYLATRPWPFVWIMIGTAIVQSLLYAFYQSGLNDIVVIFAVGGWFLALSGLVLYFAWLRPHLA